MAPSGSSRRWLSRSPPRLRLPRATRRRRRHGDAAASAWRAIVALIVGLPTLVYFLAGRPIAFELAQLAGFNLRGGLEVHPEFAALTFGLVTYTAGFIAEVVRAGVLAVPLGQSEAAAALGLAPAAGAAADRHSAGACG